MTNTFLKCHFYERNSNYFVFPLDRSWLFHGTNTYAYMWNELHIIWPVCSIIIGYFLTHCLINVSFWMIINQFAHFVAQARYYHASLSAYITSDYKTISIVYLTELNYTIRKKTGVNNRKLGSKIPNIGEMLRLCTTVGGCYFPLQWDG